MIKLKRYFIKVRYMRTFLLGLRIMRIHALKTLKQFWGKYPDAEPNLRHWYGKVEGKDTEVIV